MPPRLTAVYRMVDPVARLGLVARICFAGSCPDVEIVLRCDCDRADRRDRLPVEDGAPGRPTVGRLEHAAARPAGIV